MTYSQGRKLRPALEQHRSESLADFLGYIRRQPAEGLAVVVLRKDGRMTSHQFKLEPEEMKAASELMLAFYRQERL